MQRRELLRILAGLPVGAAAGIWTARRRRARQAEKPESTQPLVNVAPGEFTVLTGRPCNGKTRLALTVALDYADTGDGTVWFFSPRHKARELFQLFGLSLAPLDKTGENVSHDTRLNAFHVCAGGRRMPLVVFDNGFATHHPVPRLQTLFPALREQPPSLVIYDVDFNDSRALIKQPDHWLALDLLDRRRECRNLYDAALIATLGMPSVAGFSPENLTPQWPALVLRRDRVPGERLRAVHVYRMHRPYLYDPDYANDQIEILELTRPDSREPERDTQYLVVDKSARRLRNLARAEAQQVLGADV